MPISFVAASIYDTIKNAGQWKQDFLSKKQIIAAVADLVAIVGMAIIATLIVFQVIHHSSITAYSLLGTSILCILSNLVAFAIHSHKKYKASLNEKAQLRQRIRVPLHVPPNHEPQIIPDVETKLNDALLKNEFQLQEASTKNDDLKNEINSLQKNNEQLQLKLNETNQRCEQLKQALDLAQFDTQVRKQIFLRKKQGAALETPPVGSYKIEVREAVTFEVDETQQTIYVTAAQKKRMETDPYFGQFIKNSELNLDVSEDVEPFFVNLRILLRDEYIACNKCAYLRSKNFQLQLETHIKWNHSFQNLLLSKDPTFIAYVMEKDPDDLGEAISTALDFLKHADLTGNKGLVAFWLTALDLHCPFNFIIDQFEKILEIPLLDPSRLHEMLFATLARNLKKEETQEFINNHKNSPPIFKMSVLQLEHFFGCDPELHHYQESLWNLIDWQSVEVIDVQTEKLPNATCNIIKKCTSLKCLSLSFFVDKEIFEYIDEKIPIIDFTNYFRFSWQSHFLEISKQQKKRESWGYEYPFKSNANVKLQDIKLLTSPDMDQHMLNDYLQKFYGVDSTMRNIFEDYLS